MEAIYFVIPVLFLLMLGLGLEIEPGALKSVLRRPKALLVGLLSQVVVLPLVAFGFVYLLGVPPLFAVGIMLVASCPGGTSSNVLSMLVGGDIALSVTLTFFSSFITLLTLPLIVNASFDFFYGSAVAVELSVVKTIVQNFILVILPLAMGYLLRQRFFIFAEKLLLIIKKISLPCLLAMIGLFTFNHREKIFAHGNGLMGITILYVALAIFVAVLLAQFFSIEKKQRKTIIIEIVIQNAALAISIATSPYLLNNGDFAIPAVFYAVVMNVVAFGYILFVRFFLGRRVE